MSKYVKNLVTDDIRRRLENVHDALLVNMIGLNANSSHKLRNGLRSRNINILVVKSSLAARAMAGTPLARLFEGVAGSTAICWGGEDIVSLAKEVTKIIKTDEYPAFQPRGGVMDGEPLAASQVIEVAKWPNRAEQLSLLLGQILSPGANLVSQLGSVGGALASQIAQRAEGAEEGSADTTAEATVADESAEGAPAVESGGAA